MNLDRVEVVRLLREAEFTTLFTQELGWDRYAREESIDARGDTFELQAVAEKRGVQVFVCMPDPDGRIPRADVRAVIVRKLTALAHEHLLIFVDGAREEQLWIYPRRDPGKPARLIPYRFDPATSNELLLQKLESISFALNEEEELTLLGVTARLREQLDRDKLTKAFYKRFDRERSAFQSFLKGIPDSEVERWYVAVLLNRLMFIYFLQEKGFLGGGEHHYLQKKLSETHGNYYRDFLCPLFFQGFALRESERPPETSALLGQVPYLNGGIFQKHQIETWHEETIRISNQAFEGLFAFFDQYRWHLDERPLKDQREINPDVLGYIFEKYINQKQMGAYYTKEDITEYISKNTVLPFLFDAARPKCRIAFENPGGPTVWDLLSTNPDRYIYAAVRHGVIGDHGEVHPEEQLPDFVRTGMHDPKARMFDQRYNLRQAPAGDPVRLVTETWREYVSRRTRCLEIRETLQQGEVRDINDLITLNLDIRQFAQDVIENAEGPELLRAFWKAMNGYVPEKSNENYENGITILDPTCGSGAFLFAALNILEPLYEACLDCMEAFLDDLKRSGEKRRPEYLSDFRKILERVKEHPNRRYFIFKSIILNNLFGVDIMEEAVEICKLRLFLKLAAQVDPNPAKPNFGIEPLPDIDFNIRAGNTLVGYATADEVRKVFTEDTDGQGKLQFGEVLSAFERFEEQVELADHQFKLFRKMQTDPEMDLKKLAETKEGLQESLKDLEEELNGHLAEEYGVQVKKKKEYAKWLKSHQPFHWFVEFYGIMKEGGFDVIIGNPPYVEYKKIYKYYTIRGYDTINCGNLYAYTWERCLRLIDSKGMIGLIIPVSSVCTDGYGSLRNLWLSKGMLFVSNFNDRPGKLFEGLEHIRLSVVILKKSNQRHVYSTVYNKWFSEIRGQLFNLIVYNRTDSSVIDNFIPKVGSRIEEAILSKVGKINKKLEYFSSKTGNYCIYYTRKLSWFVQIIDFIPLIIDSKGKKREPSELKVVRFREKYQRDAFLAVLNSSFFYWFLSVWSDCRNLNKREVLGVPFDISNFELNEKKILENIVVQLMLSFKDNSKIIESNYKKWGKMKIQCIYPRLSKSIVDKMDQLISSKFSFNDKELDFVINYDIKYRIGLIE